MLTAGCFVQMSYHKTSSSHVLLFQLFSEGVAVFLHSLVMIYSHVAVRLTSGTCNPFYSIVFFSDRSVGAGLHSVIAKLVYKRLRCRLLVFWTVSIRLCLLLDASPVERQKCIIIQSKYSPPASVEHCIDSITSLPMFRKLNVVFGVHHFYWNFILSVMSNAQGLTAHLMKNSALTTYFHLCNSASFLWLWNKGHFLIIIITIKWRKYSVISALSLDSWQGAGCRWF